MHPMLNIHTASKENNKTANGLSAKEALALSEVLKVNTTLTALDLWGVQQQMQIPSRE